MANDITPDISDRRERHQYELDLDGKLAAHIAYRMRGDDTIELVHTEVAPEHEGKGLASRIAKFALDDARSRHLQVIPSCSYIASWIKKHADYEELVAQR